MLRIERHLDSIEVLNSHPSCQEQPVHFTLQAARLENNEA